MSGFAHADTFLEALTPAPILNPALGPLRCAILEALEMKKAAPIRTALSSLTPAGDQAAAIALPFCLRRYVMKARQQKPRIIMAHVEGSRTAAIAAIGIFSLERKISSVKPKFALIRIRLRFQPHTSA